MRCGLPVSAVFLVYGDTYRIIFGWCFLVCCPRSAGQLRLPNWVKAVTLPSAMSYDFHKLVTAVQIHRFFRFLPKNGHSIWCILRTWFFRLWDITRLNDCSVFSLTTSDNESCSGRKFYCFLVRPSDFRSYCFTILNSLLRFWTFGYIWPAYPTLILRRQEQKQRDKIKPIPSVIFKDFTFTLNPQTQCIKIIFKNYGWYRLKFSKSFLFNFHADFPSASII